MSTNQNDQQGTGASEVSVSAVELFELTKSYGAVTACDAVNLTLYRGKIHGILGENGAGKSTLMKMLIGLVSPDNGIIRIDGTPQQIHSPQAAAALGIGMVHQHFSLVDALTVWENVALGEEGRLNRESVRNRVGEIAEHYGLMIDPDAMVGDLPAGLRQRVEIVKCLRRDPRIVIFDEPTSVLTPEESERLFRSFRDVVAAEGRAVVLVSHKLDEILAATDDVTIMRHGKVVDRYPTSEADAPTLARSMVGREVSLRSQRATVDSHTDNDRASSASVTESEDPDIAPVLAVRDVVATDHRGAVLLDNLSIEVAKGEIVGVAGVEGNGQRALGDLLSSLVSLDSGDVRVNGSAISTNRPGAMAKAGIAVIPEDRHDSGVVLDMTVAENLVLVDPNAVSRNGVIDTRELNGLARSLIEEFEIQCAGPNAPLWTLSGGNQQRVVLARELNQNPRVLVAAHPTRGLDVGAVEYMTNRLRKVAASGVAVLLISSELEEIFDLADRIAVMFRGRVVGTMARADADLVQLGLLMGGAAA